MQFASRPYIPGTSSEVHCQQSLSRLNLKHWSLTFLPQEYICTLCRVQGSLLMLHHFCPQLASRMSDEPSPYEFMQGGMQTKHKLVFKPLASQMQPTYKLACKLAAILKQPSLPLECISYLL